MTPRCAVPRCGNGGMCTSLDVRADDAPLHRQAALGAVLMCGQHKWCGPAPPKARHQLHECTSSCAQPHTLCCHADAPAAQGLTRAVLMMRQCCIISSAAGRCVSNRPARGRAPGPPTRGRQPTTGRAVSPVWSAPQGSPAAHTSRKQRCRSGPHCAAWDSRGSAGARSAPGRRRPTGSCSARCAGCSALSAAAPPRAPHAQPGRTTRSTEASIGGAPKGPRALGSAQARDCRGALRRQPAADAGGPWSACAGAAP